MTAPQRSTWMFDPAAPTPPTAQPPVVRRGDQRPETGYVYDVDGRIALAINVSLVTGRPLLIRGKPGTGKSSLAADIADKLGRRYYAQTITSRTRARDLQWSFDTLQRLNDSSTGNVKDPHAYVSPGMLWWTFSPQTAALRGLDEGLLAARGLTPLVDPSPRAGAGAVLLLDEIDKADPDLPNDLLLPLGSLRFGVTDVEGHPSVEATGVPPLVVITTNEERDLPEAFVRRCVVLALPEAKHDRMIEVAKAHYAEDVDSTQLEEVYEAYERIRATRTPDAHEPSLAEFLDAVAAVVALKAKSDGNVRWKQIVEFTLEKPGRQ